MKKIAIAGEPGDVFRKIRQALKISQGDLANFFKVSQSLVAQVESGKRTFVPDRFPDYHHLADFADLLFLISNASTAAKYIFKLLDTDVYLPSSLFNFLPDYDNNIIDIYSLSQFFQNFLNNTRKYLFNRDFRSIRQSPSNFEPSINNLKKLVKYNLTSAFDYSVEYPDKMSCLSIEYAKDVDYPLSTSRLDMYFKLGVFIEDQITCALRGNKKLLARLIFQFGYNIPASDIVVKPDCFGILHKHGVFYTYFPTSILSSYFSSLLSYLQMDLPFLQKK